MDVLDAEQPEIRVAVKCLCANDLISGEQALFQSVTDTGIQDHPSSKNFLSKNEMKSAFPRNSQCLQHTWRFFL